MGTRNLTCVVKDGEYKVAQYGQWDGYPEVSGVNILNALRKYGKEKLAERLDSVKFISDDAINAIFSEHGAKNGMMSLSAHDEFSKNYPSLARDTGSSIIDHICRTEGQVILEDSISFVSDSLFCEWAYVVDLDKNTFEVYKGFVKEPHEGQRFSSFEKCEEYYPVEHVVTFDLDKLPSDDELCSRVNELVVD